MATSTPVLQDPRAEVQGLMNTTVLAGVVKSSSQAAGQSLTEAREGAAGSIQRWGRDELAAAAWSVPAAACRGTGETGETSAFQGEEENTSTCMRTKFKPTAAYVRKCVVIHPKSLVWVCCHT